MIAQIAIKVSLSLYRVLLLLYPSGFRKKYSSPMLQTFAESLEARPLSLGHFCKAWWVVLLELPETVVAQHASEFRERFGQSLSRFWLALAVPAAVMARFVQDDRFRPWEWLSMVLAILVAACFTAATSGYRWKRLTFGALSGSAFMALCVLIDASIHPPINHEYSGLIVFVLSSSIGLLFISFSMIAITEAAPPISHKIEDSNWTDLVSA